MDKKIPKVIYQSWKTKELPEKMSEMVEKTKKMNPEYTHEIWDDNDCREFLFKHFGENYANAFDILIPGAFKCDFWRYAVLYINGGIYMDMDMTPEVPFREILREDDKFVSIVDQKNGNCSDSAIYQAFIACVPKHQIMLDSLQISFNNIVTRTYEVFCSLSVTGPVVVGLAINLYWKKKNVHEKIEPGEYKDGIRLFKMNPEKTWDNSGKKIFNNKYEGYTRVSGNYSLMSSYYKDDPKRGFRQKIKYIFGIILIIIIFFLSSTIIYKKKFKDCQKTCYIK